MTTLLPVGATVAVAGAEPPKVIVDGVVGAEGTGMVVLPIARLPTPPELEDPDPEPLEPFELPDDPGPPDEPEPFELPDEPVPPDEPELEPPDDPVPLEEPEPLEPPKPPEPPEDPDPDPPEEPKPEPEPPEPPEVPGPDVGRALIV